MIVKMCCNYLLIAHYNDEKWKKQHVSCCAFICSPAFRICSPMWSLCNTDTTFALKETECWVKSCIIRLLTPVRLYSSPLPLTSASSLTRQVVTNDQKLLKSCVYVLTALCEQCSRPQQPADTNHMPSFIRLSWRLDVTTVSRFGCFSFLCHILWQSASVERWRGLHVWALDAVCCRHYVPPWLCWVRRFQ